MLHLIRTGNFALGSIFTLIIFLLFPACKKDDVKSDNLRCVASVWTNTLSGVSINTHYSYQDDKLQEMITEQYSNGVVMSSKSTFSYSQGLITKINAVGSGQGWHVYAKEEFHFAGGLLMESDRFLSNDTGWTPQNKYIYEFNVNENLIKYTRWDCEGSIWKVFSRFDFIYQGDLLSEIVYATRDFNDSIHDLSKNSLIYSENRLVKVLDSIWHASGWSFSKSYEYQYVGEDISQIGYKRYEYLIPGMLFRSITLDELEQMEYTYETGSGNLSSFLKWENPFNYAIQAPASRCVP